MKNRVLLISPGHDGEHATHKSHRRVHRDPPPLGLLYIGTALRAAGYEVDILDTHVTSEWMWKLERMVASREYLWCGVSVIIGQRQRNAAQITTLVKQVDPTLPVVWGGTMATVCGEAMDYSYKLADHIVSGEGEQWAVDYTNAQARNRQLKVCAPIPDWTLFRENYNREQVPYFHMLMTSRGCPMKCTFCYKHTATGGYRLSFLDDVKRQIQTMHDQVGTRVWTIGDDNFLGDGERAARLLEWMREKGFYFEEVIGHVGQLTEYLAERMAGVVPTFIFSVESASPRLQRIVKKGVAVDTVPMKMGWLGNHGIAANCSFIFGLPTETQQERDANAELMRRIREQNDMVRGVSYVFMPLPGTPILPWIERELKVNLTFPVKDYEQANFWPEVGDVGNKFRPWLSESEYDDIVAQAVQFRKDWAFPRTAPYKLDEVLDEQG